MDLALFDYALPPSLIAQEPAEPRDASRLLLLDRGRRAWEDRRFVKLPDLLMPGDCVVVNSTRVIAARMLGEAGSGGPAVEVLFLRELAPTRWEVLVRPGRRARRGARIGLADGEATGVVVEEQVEGVRVLEVESPAPVLEMLERHGLPPLPPYIERHRAPKPEDRERYQTVYAREPGSVAAPTAGFHFTVALLAGLAARGVEVHDLQLHVGPGTFRPVRTARVESHRMEPEAVTIPVHTADAINQAKAAGRRVVAVGTTTTRALEWAADESGRVSPRIGDAGLFIHPPYRFRVVDALVTNFHQPRSTLLLLVSAFAGRELVLAAYAHAVARGYRFYSYGDAMLIV